MRICMIGTGYVGLVTGTCLADMGNDVLCLDVNEELIKNLKEGKIHIFEPGLEELVKRNVKEKRLAFTTDYKSAIKNSKIIFVAVGTPQAENGSADLSYVFSAAKEIAKHMDSYKVVVVKSTVPVGTSEKVRKIIKENLKKSISFDIVDNPETLREGEAIKDFMIPDRVIIGTDSEKAKKIMRELYKGVERADKPIIFTDIHSSELIKYVSNAMLAMRISFMNQIAPLCEKVGADVKDVAKGVGLDDRIGPRFLQAGAGYGGSCLVGEESIIVKSEKKVYPILLKDFFIKFKKNRNFEVLSFDIKNKKISFNKILTVTKRKYKGTLIKVKTSMNKFLTCTEDHPLIVFDKDKFKIKLAKDLSLKDQIPSSLRIPNSIDNLKIDVIKLLDTNKFEFKKVRLRPFKKHFQLIIDEIKDSFTPERKRDILRSNCMNLIEFLKIEDKISNEIRREDLVLFTSKGNTTYCPATINFNKDFCTFLGYYVSEGHIHYEKCLRGIRARIGIHFNNKEKEYINEVKNILNNLNVSFNITDNTKNSTTSFIISSRILAFILDDVLDCGTDSYSANVPDEIFSLNNNLRKSFLRGVFRGDGHIAFPKNTNSVVYDFGSISYSLVHKMIFLFHALSIVPSYKTSKSKKSTDYAHFLRISTKRQILELKNYKDKKIQERVWTTLNGCKDIASCGFTKKNNDFCVTRIKELKNEEKEVEVYSLEVDKNNTFVTSHGIIVHNCFPKDIRALAYTLKEHSFGSEILDAVDKVNEKTKQSIIHKIKKLVPDLKEKKIAVWGLSFKPKTNDMREAPSITLIKQLQAEGAKVRVFDPEAMNTAKIYLENVEHAKNPYHALEGCDAVVLITEWDEFRNLDKKKVKSILNKPNFIDARNVHDPKEMKELGFNYVGVGR